MLELANNSTYFNINSCFISVSFYHPTLSYICILFTEFLRSLNERDPEKVGAPVGMNAEPVQSSSAPYFFYNISMATAFTVTASRRGAT